MTLRFAVNKHPGGGYVYVICDICGRKVRRKDTQLISDKYNFQNGLVVCNYDIDRINEQSLPVKIKERIVDDPKSLRPEQADRFVENENDDRVPSAPQQLEAKASTVGATVDLFWQGPQDNGSSMITGYVIERASPQYSVYEVINPNTMTDTTYYNDTSADITQEYTYRIAAINGAGTGPYSEEAPFPAPNVSPGVNYLTVSQDDSVLETGSGDFIVI